MKKISLTCFLGMLFLASYFPVRFPMTPLSQVASNLSVLLIAAPSLIGLYKWLGPTKAISTFLILGCFALTIENIAVLTGFPYGSFRYGSDLGFKILQVPWTVPFAWIPILLGSFAISFHLEKKNFLLICAYTSLSMTVVDLILDPGAVSLRYWVWLPAGIFYGVPLSNFLGWLITSMIGSLLLLQLIHKTLREFQKHFHFFTLNILIIITFWSGVNFWQSQWIAFLIGLGSIIGVLTLHLRKISHD